MEVKYNRVQILLESIPHTPSALSGPRSPVPFGLNIFLLSDEQGGQLVVKTGAL